MKFALSLALILGLAMVSQAAIVQTVGTISVDVTIDTVTPPTTAGLTAYVISLQSIYGVSGADGRIDAVDGYLYQTLAYAGAALTPQGVGLNATGKKNDTYILVPAANIVATRLPDENVIGFDPEIGDDPTLHNGTTLCGVADPQDYSKTMAFGITGGATNLAFARVVLAEGSSARFNFLLDDGTTKAAQFNFLIPVPEPMTLSLLAAGALALIRRRR